LLALPSRCAARRSDEGVGGGRYRGIVEIEPQWRGYDYFLVGDEVVVVDPDTFEIVAVIPA